MPFNVHVWRKNQIVQVFDFKFITLTFAHVCATLFLWRNPEPSAKNNQFTWSASIQKSQIEQ